MHTCHYPFKPIPLPYDFGELEPCLCRRTIQVHYNCHYLKYVEKLNDALKGYPNYWNESLFCLLTQPDRVPSDVRTAVLNNGGGVLNHQLYFNSMTPCRHQIPERLQRKLEKAFTSVEKFEKCFIDAGLSVFGSGYGALVADKSGRLKILTFPKQDASYLCDYIPLVVCDVWEHAYYLQFQSDRKAYLEAFVKLINWQWAAEQLNQTR